MPELPLEIWKERIENEIKGLSRLQVLEPGSILRNKDSVEMILKIKAFGFLKKKKKLVPQTNHRVFIKINRAFPYPGGIDFAWFSNIYHPNIHPVELTNKQQGTGYICLNVLKKWSRLSDLETTIKALKMLVENPNPDDPLNYDICLDATEFFKVNTMEDLMKEYDFSTEEEDDDEIKIIED
ncbi:MAG: ubiquitin-conjugating enzyme E2 [Promethearchaeota archaeon]